MERKLVTVRVINALTVIENADSIEAAQIDGWQVVVKKGEFAVNQKIVFFEVDSFLPIDARYEFLRKNRLRRQDGVEGFRLRTVKLRGAISQGLVLPLYLFPELLAPSVSMERHLNQDEAIDYADLLGVVKWEPPVAAHLAGMAKGNFPSRIRKTDQERIQNLPYYFDGRFNGVPFEGSIKLDGSSCTVYFDAGTFGVCSRNLDLKEDETNSFWKAVNALGLREYMTQLDRNVAIQAELIGEGIQGNKEGLHGQELRVFDIWDIDLQRHLTAMERYDYLASVPTIKHVPVLGQFINIFDICPTMQDMVAYSGNGPSLNAQIREGVVFKSTLPIRGEIVSFKVINPQFLLKERD